MGAARRRSRSFAVPAGAGSLAAGAHNRFVLPGEGVGAGRVARQRIAEVSPAGGSDPSILRVTPLVNRKPSLQWIFPTAATGAGRTHIILLHQLFCFAVMGMLHIGPGSAGDLHSDLLLAMVCSPSTTHPLQRRSRWGRPLLAAVDGGGGQPAAGLSSRDSAAAATFVARSRDAAVDVQREQRHPAVS